MNAAVGSRQRALFEQALDLPIEARRAFVESECADDAELRRSVLELLTLDADLADAVVDRIAPLSRTVLQAQAQQPGQRIGAYRLLHELGSGGMGTVFLAARDDGVFQQRVAIKLIRGFPTQDAMQRFKRERDLLAQLAHPQIARLLDGGNTDSGQPWLAMEYIEGRTLGDWLLQEQPSLTRRLDAFCKLCNAVHHAHQHLVIHRDIKPGNVLIRQGDDPVLLDFGIGKLLAESSDARATTSMGALTPDYASPEQLAGRPTSVASDIYALGLLLYELLAGRPMRGDPTQPAAAQKPTRPSEAAGRAASEWLRHERSRIRGDLDWITLKALRPEPERRYSSAAALADDIVRFQSGRVVEAAPERLSYVIGKWLRRHPLATVATLLTLALIAGFSWQLKIGRDRAVLAERKAVAEADAAKEVTQFMMGLFANADPAQARGREISAREMLERGSSELDKKLIDQPLLRARLLAAVGTIYHSIGLPEPSIAALSEAVRLLERSPNADPLQLASALNELGRTYSSVQNYRQALIAHQRGLDLREQHLPPLHVDIGHSCSALGVALNGLSRHDEAEKVFQRGLGIFEQAGAEGEEHIAALWHNLGLVARDRRQFDIARDYYQRALAIKQKYFGPRHPRTLNTIEALAVAASEVGNLDETEQWLKQSYAVRLLLHGPVSLDVARVLNEMASLDQDRGRFNEAEGHYRAALAIHEKLNTDDTMSAAGVLNNLATLLEERGDPRAAEALQQRSLQIRERINGAEHHSVHRARHNLARQWLAQGRNEDAARGFALAHAGRTAVFGEQHPETLDSAFYALLVAQRSSKTELVPLHAALEALRKARGRGTALLRAERAMIDLLPESTRLDSLITLHKAASTTLAATHPLVAEVQLCLAEQYMAVGDVDRARAALAGSAKILRAELVPDSAVLRRLQAVEREMSGLASRTSEPRTH